MSILKNLDTDLTYSEKKTLRSFLILYVVFTLVILSLTSTLYYSLQKELKVQENIILLNDYTSELIPKLETLDTTKDIFPDDINFKVSLYNANYELVYSTFEKPALTLDKVVYNTNTIIRYIKNPKKSYLNTQYIVTSMPEDIKWLNNIKNTIILYGSIFFIFMIIIGYYLLNLFLKPMKNALALLNKFINDTTHELNTPISTITTNIEILKDININNKLIEKAINRIDIGAKTISNIYDDLTYLILNHKLISKNENINLKDIVEQRIEYFHTLIQMKNISLNIQLEDNNIINIDKIKLSKLIDNILSNAIKYNKKNGDINITLKDNTLYIKDTGIGIKEQNISKILNRYSRFNNTVGGFGIGLNIVKLICDEYKIDIKINSIYNQYTEVILKF